MIEVQCNSRFFKEKSYVVEKLLKDFTGITFNLNIIEDSDGYIFKYKEKIIMVPDIFFAKEGRWLTKDKLPSSCKNIIIKKSFKDIGRESIPVLFGYDQNEISIDDSTFSIDIIGSLFFFLSGYEDLVITNKDKHGRPTAYDYAARRFNFTDIPVVNYYLELFFQYVNYNFNLDIKIIKFNQFYLTIDIDHPSSLNMNLKKKLKTLLKDILLKRDINAFLKRFIAIVYNNYKIDPYNFIPYIKKENILYKTNVIIFFMNVLQSFSIHDEKYKWNSKFMKYYLQECNDNNIKIGLHLSYNTGASPDLLKKEINDFKIKKFNLHNNSANCIRHHYLRLNPSYSFKLMNDLGFEMDSSKGFADEIGFKSSICFPYRTFDIINREALDLFEMPFMVMDRALISNERKFNDTKLFSLIDEVKKFNGTFVYLAHNCELGYKKWQKKLLKLINYYHKR